MRGSESASVRSLANPGVGTGGWRRRGTDGLEDEGEDLGDSSTVKSVVVVVENIQVRHAHVVEDRGGSSGI